VNKRKTISIKDVAKESGSSLTTVSLVLNERDHRISPATRERVLETAHRLGYRPNRLAQGLQSRRSSLIAIMVPQLRHAFADVYFGELISAIHDCANRSGYKILLEVAHPEFVRNRLYLELFDRNFVDGLLCLGVTNKDIYLRDLAEAGHAMIVVNNYLPAQKLNFVRCDYLDAGRIAADYLLGLGHRRIGLIHGAPEVQTSLDLRKGFQQALTAGDVKLPESCVEDGLYTEEGGEAAARRLIERQPQITAILAGNDKMAIGAVTGLKDLGKRVPEDVSVIGCDDIHPAGYCDPPLTTVHTPIYELGRRACERLLELIEGRVDQVREVHPVNMTVRKSACPPRPR